MIQRLLAVALMLAPALCLAEEAPPPAPVETPWGAMIAFLVVCLVIGAWTIWAVVSKKDDDKKSGKD